MTARSPSLVIACVLASVVGTVGAGCGQEVRSYERNGMTLHHIVLSIANVWVLDVHGGGILMIDAATKDDGEHILDGLKAVEIDPSAVDMVLLTHGHLDHAGAGKFLQDHLDAPVALGRSDLKMAKDGNSPVPEPQNAEGVVLRPLLDPHFPAFTPDLLLGAEDRLDDIGVPATIVPVPGHTDGSIAVVVDGVDGSGGDAFVGDVVRGNNEGSRGEHEGRCDTHLFSNDFHADRDSMEGLLARGVSTFFPGHGPFFDHDTVRGWLEDTEDK